MWVGAAIFIASLEEFKTSHWSESLLLETYMQKHSHKFTWIDV